jgi:hypothetical protein
MHDSDIQREQQIADEWLEAWTEAQLDKLWAAYADELPWNDAGPDTRGAATMSWDATLEVTDTTACPHCGGAVSTATYDVEDWNYTHNTNGMIAAAYEAVSGEQTEECDGPLGPVIGAAWWRRLDGASGGDGAAYLGQIIKGLEADPERFRAMNPENGWGDYDRLLKVLHDMRAAVSRHDLPTTWHVSG